MTTEVKVESILEKIEDLSVADLLTVQERITNLLRQKTANGTGNSSAIANSNGHKQETEAVTTDTITDDDEEPDKIYPYPGSPIYRYTPKGARKALEAMFTPEELEAAANFDLSTLPKLEKTSTEYISEMREERM
jgi:hypothetical protein